MRQLSVILRFLFRCLKHDLQWLILPVFLFQIRPAQSQVLKQNLNKVAENHRVYGMNIIVCALGQPVAHYHYGLQNVGFKIATTDSTRYRVASISKVITTIALMQLYENHLCSLDADVSDYLPFTLRNPAFPDMQITLRMLLSHTASLNDGDGLTPFVNATLFTDPPPGIQELLSQTGKYYAPNMFLPNAPGTYFSYCNLNFAIIATVVEKLSGERFDIYCKEHIFKPLHIHCSFNLHDINMTTLAPLYRGQNGQPMVQFDVYTPGYTLPNDPTLYTPGNNGLLYLPLGGLRASVPELAAIWLCLAHKGQFKHLSLLHDTTIQRMHGIYWHFAGSNGESNNQLFQAWGAGTHIAQSHHHGDIVFPNDTLFGHMGDAFGLLSDAYLDKNGNGLIFVTNGAALPFGQDTSSGCYKLEADVFRTVFDYVQGCVTGLTEIKNDSGFILDIFPQPLKSSIIFRYVSLDNEPLDIKISKMNNQTLLSQKLIKRKVVGSYTVGNTHLIKGFYNLTVSYHHHTYQKLIYWNPPVVKPITKPIKH